LEVGAPGEGTLLELLDGLLRIPSPAGHELPVARWAAEWLGAQPGVECALDEFSPGRANVVCRPAAGPGPRGPGGRVDLVVYGHLDTTLSGDPSLDRMAVPDADLPGPLERRGDTLHGHGLAVAKGPAAAAAAGFLCAARELDALGGAASGAVPVLLLASGGTHRAAPPGLPIPSGAPATGAGAGVRRFLALERPGAAVVAKCGPPGLLVEEPGAAYVTVEVTGPPGLSMHGSAMPGGGVPGATPAALAGVERWRSAYVGRPVPPGSQVGRDAAVGALAAGVPYKADLVGGVLQLHLYVVLLQGDDPDALAREIEDAVSASLAAAGRGGLSVTAAVVEAVAAGSTPPDARVARVAEASYRSVFATPPPPVTGWTGSTDGVLFRSAGVDTVRLGPTPLPAPLGHDALSLPDLLGWARLYATLVVEYCAGPA
jgi:acetylornithine deacetylase/succinyl-diaminopimelate desuccinylase-like protein